MVIQQLIGATIRIGQEMLCRPYAGFRLKIFYLEKFWLISRIIFIVQFYNLLTMTFQNTDLRYRGTSFLLGQLV